MPESSFSYKNSRIHYRRSGWGPDTLICFHGYGEDSQVFDFLSKYVGEQFTVYAIDLPFHGKTRWNEGLLFTSDDLVHIVNGILSCRRTGSSSSEFCYSVMGFSLGGRMGLSLYQAVPEKIKKLILLAPDGLKVNFWYWLATQTRPGNKLFAFTMKYPYVFLGILKLLHQFKLTNASIYKFVNHYIEDKEVRKLLYARWTTLRKIKPCLPLIKSTICKLHTPVRLIYGKYDRIILSSVGERFLKGIEAHCVLSVIPSGHQVLHEKNADYIIENLIR